MTEKQQSKRAFKAQQEYRISFRERAVTCRANRDRVKFFGGSCVLAVPSRVLLCISRCKPSCEWVGELVSMRDGKEGRRGALTSPSPLQPVR